MRRTEQSSQILVVAAVLIGISHNEPYRTACALALEDAAQKLNAVCLLAVGGYLALSRLATVELVLNKVLIDLYACRKSVDNTAYGSAVALAKGCYSENITKCIAHFMFAYVVYSSCAPFFTCNRRNRLRNHPRSRRRHIRRSLHNHRSWH